MSHHQHGHALLGQVLHDGEDFSHHLRVQGGGGFVEQQHLRLHGQGPGNGHPLLLAAGDLPGLGLDVRRHAHLFQILHGPLPGGLLVLFQYLDLPDHAIFQHGHVVEQVEGLEHHAHMGAVLGGIDLGTGDVLAAVEDLAAGGGLQQVDAPQQGALAGAGGTNDAGDIAFFHGEIDVPQHFVAAEGLAQMPDL